VQAHEAARILVVGHAPGLRAHAAGIPWNDAGGARLRVDGSDLQLTLLIGHHAQRHFLRSRHKRSLTETTQA
jgi:hypothetical protein